MPARIAVLGAPGTGKTTLCHALSDRLRTRGHRIDVTVPGHAPGSASPASEILIEDGPEWQDRAALRDCDLLLLMGLDLPAADAASRQAADADLRARLTEAGLGWRVVYGLGPERVRQALDAVAAVLPWAWQITASDEEIGRWSRLRAHCDKCGDADCEHRLFTGGTLRPTAPPT